MVAEADIFICKITSFCCIYLPMINFQPNRFLLLSADSGRYVLSCSTSGKQAWQTGDRNETASGNSNSINSPSPSHRLHVLRTFYHQAVESHLVPSESSVFMIKTGKGQLSYEVTKIMIKKYFFYLGFKDFSINMSLLIKYFR